MQIKLGICFGPFILSNRGRTDIFGWIGAWTGLVQTGFGQISVEYRISS